jgi:hypothetical protein
MYAVLSTHPLVSTKERETCTGYRKNLSERGMRVRSSTMKVEKGSDMIPGRIRGTTGTRIYGRGTIKKR